MTTDFNKADIRQTPTQFGGAVVYYYYYFTTHQTVSREPVLMT